MCQASKERQSFPQLHILPNRPHAWLTSVSTIPRDAVRPAGETYPYFTATRDGRWIAWSQIDHLGSDLMLVENFR